MHDMRNILGSIKRKVSSSSGSGTQNNSRAYPTIQDPYGTPSRTGTMKSQYDPPPQAPVPAPLNQGTAPPAYSPVSNAFPVPQIAVSSPQDQTADDPYAFLSSFDTIFLIDDSGSMAGSRWRETQEALEAITPICTSHDADGIDILFLNNPENPYHRNVSSPATVREIFSSVRPRGGTPTGQRLDSILRPYIRQCEQRGPEAVKPLNLIVITDGEPSDDVEAPLISCAKKLDKMDAPAWQIGIQFFQVGRDEGARAHLRALDDELAEIAGTELRDMVDTVPFKGAEGEHLSADGILKVVLGAVNRRLDRKRSKDLHR
ncbi:hypothetical protein D6D05_08423 [Aureobasidium pullulans]|nr:hypothetical protein D6D05_08423 [Aureobasidium pullulans]